MYSYGFSRESRKIDDNSNRTNAAQAPAKGIQVTEKALAKMRTAMVKEGISPEQGGLRLGVQGGGCSGLSYNIRFDTQPRERDRIFQFGDVRVFVDPKSFIYLHGMILDYQETLMQQGFVFVNPNAIEVLRLRHFVLRLMLVWRGRPRPRTVGATGTTWPHERASSCPAGAVRM